MPAQSTGPSVVSSGHAPVTPSVAEKVENAIKHAEQLRDAHVGTGLQIDRVGLRKTLADLEKLMSDAAEDPLVAQEGNLGRLRRATDGLHALLLGASPMQVLSAGELATRTATSASKVASDAMYVEKQEVSACGAHAINAFLGGKVMTRGEFDDWIKDLTAGMAVEQLSEIRAKQSSADGVGWPLVHKMLGSLSHKQDSARAPVGAWTVSALASEDGIGDVRLPKALDRTDRAVIEVKTGFGLNSQLSVLRDNLGEKARQSG